MGWLSRGTAGGGRIAAEAYSKNRMLRESLKLDPIVDKVVKQAAGAANGSNASAMTELEADGSESRGLQRGVSESRRLSRKGSESSRLQMQGSESSEL